jgi:hypothetical protein
MKRENKYKKIEINNLQYFSENSINFHLAIFIFLVFLRDHVAFLIQTEIYHR